MTRLPTGFVERAVGGLVHFAARIYRLGPIIGEKNSERALAKFSRVHGMLGLYSHSYFVN